MKRNVFQSRQNLGSVRSCVRTVAVRGHCTPQTEDEPLGAENVGLRAIFKRAKHRGSDKSACSKQRPAVCLFAFELAEVLLFWHAYGVSF